MRFPVSSADAWRGLELVAAPVVPAVPTVSGELIERVKMIGASLQTMKDQLLEEQEKWSQQLGSSRVCEFSRGMSGESCALQCQGCIESC